MIGHLGSRVSALLDGQLSAEEAERAWEHVHACHACRDQVEREGWVKRRLTGLSFDVAAPSTPVGLKSSLLGGPPGDAYLAVDAEHRRRSLALAALGGGAVGAAVMGVLVLGIAPADAPSPSPDRRVPQMQVSPASTLVPRSPSPTTPGPADTSTATSTSAASASPGRHARQR